MGLRSTLTTLLTSPLATLLEARLREIAEETLSERDYAAPGDVRALSDHLDHAHRSIDALQREVAELRARLEGLERPEPSSSASDAALQVAAARAEQEEAARQADALTEAVHEVSDTSAALRGRIDDAAALVDEQATRAEAARAAADASAARLADLSAPAAPADKTPPADRGCRVEGCDGKHRARGFCGGHYMMWKRGTLPGFVLDDGTVYFEEGGPRFELGAAHKGKAARLVDGAAVLA